MKRSRAGILWGWPWRSSGRSPPGPMAQGPPGPDGPSPPEGRGRPERSSVVRASQDVPAADRSPARRRWSPLALDPGLPRGSPATPSAPVSLHYDNRDIRQVLEIFSRTEKLNLLISPNVGGPITVNLDGVTRQQALEAILSLGNLEVRRTTGADLHLHRRGVQGGHPGPSEAVDQGLPAQVRPGQRDRGDDQAVPQHRRQGDRHARGDEGIDENANFASGLPGVSSHGRRRPAAGRRCRGPGVHRRQHPVGRGRRRAPGLSREPR